MTRFNIVKPYAMAWWPRILNKLNKIIPKGTMSDFTSNFLNHLTFQVKPPNTLSDTFLQDNGGPGGLISSITFLDRYQRYTWSTYTPKHTSTLLKRLHYPLLQYKDLLFSTHFISQTYSIGNIWACLQFRNPTFRFRFPFQTHQKYLKC